MRVEVITASGKKRKNGPNRQQDFHSLQICFACLISSTHDHHNGRKQSNIWGWALKTYVSIHGFFFISFDIQSYIYFLKFAAKMEARSKLACESVVGVESGDTCFGLAQSHHLTATAFSAINPNLNCTALFVGQWLCVDASAS